MISGGSVIGKSRITSTIALPLKLYLDKTYPAGIDIKMANMVVSREVHKLNFMEKSVDGETMPFKISFGVV